MPQAPILTSEGILLDRQATGEHFLRLAFLTPDTGILHAAIRSRSFRSGKTPCPDLFDEAKLTLDPPRKGSGTLRFINEYRIIRRHERLGSRYSTLAWACRFARVLAANPLPDTSAAHLHTTLQRALRAWEMGHPPEGVYFKALYIFARDEGLPVSEEWFTALHDDDRTTVETLLNRPAANIRLQPELMQRIVRGFEKYLRGEHDLRIPQPPLTSPPKRANDTP